MVQEMVQERVRGEKVVEGEIVMLVVAHRVARVMVKVGGKERDREGSKMSISNIIGLSILGGLWFCGVCAYIYSWAKTRTLPFQLPDDELFRKAFGVEKPPENKEEKWEKDTG